MSKARASTQETMVFTLETRDDEPAGTKKRARKTTPRVIGKPSMSDDDDDEAEEDAAPAPKSHKLMGVSLSQGLLLQSPRLPPKLLLKPPSLHPIESLEIYLLKRRTRPQCLKLK